MRYLFSWPTIRVYSFFIIVISVLPVKPPQLFFPFQDKVIHGLIYGLLSFLAANTFSRKKINNPKTCSFFYAFSLGLFVEIIQYFLPLRSFEFRDILANLLGSFLGVLLIIGEPVEDCPQPQKKEVIKA